jgi:septal ring factor EnvC (AmiA/AmiB activator)
VRDLLVGAGATVLAEHTVGESASGDGLIAVSFDPRDEDLTVPVSHVRAVDSLYGELEHELAAAQQEAASLRDRLEDTQRELEETTHELERARRRARRLRRRLSALQDVVDAGTSSSTRRFAGNGPLTSWLRRRP